MAYIPNVERYTQMEYRRCGRSGLKLPLLSMLLWHNFGDTNSLEHMAQLCETAFDGGITHFDLANNYGPPAGAAERNFGKLLKTIFAGHRDELVISTKPGYDMWEGPYGEWGSRKYLLAQPEKGRIAAVVPGERFSIFDETTRRALQQYPHLRQDRDLERENMGVTFIFLRRF